VWVTWSWFEGYVMPLEVFDRHWVFKELCWLECLVVLQGQMKHSMVLFEALMVTLESHS
jgi:hypothetical protein